MEAEAQASPLKKAIMNWAKSAALENHQQVMEGKREYGVENGSLKYRLAHKIVLSKIHLALGLDRTILKINGRNSGGAAISETTLHYFTSIGLFINQLFGATESTGENLCLMYIRQKKIRSHRLRFDRSAARDKGMPRRTPGWHLWKTIYRS